jgi:exonuclease III
MPSSTRNSILILQFNANGLKNHVNELQLVLQEKRIDIALISETHFTKHSYVPIAEYNLLKSNHPDNTAHGGAAIYIKSSLLYQSLPNFCQPYLQSCAILLHLNNIPTTIAAIYSPPRHNMNIQYKSLWDAAKKFLKNVVPNTQLIKSDGSFASSDADKAELLKNHLPETFSPYTEIQTPQNTKLVKQYLDSSLPLYLPTKLFTPNDVKYAIQKYSLKKSPGYDLIIAEVARCLPKRAIILLTVLFNAVLRLTYFPLLWKFSIIILFHKPKKPPDLPSSYRPISLLPFFAKIFERLILKRIFPCIYSSNVLPNTQFGFRANHSTTHQLHRLVDAISLSLEKKNTALAYFSMCLKRLIVSGTKAFSIN